jgi:hypothetical protein
VPGFGPSSAPLNGPPMWNFVAVHSRGPASKAWRRSFESHQRIEEVAEMRDSLVTSSDEAEPFLTPPHFSSSVQID